MSVKRYTSVGIMGFGDGTHEDANGNYVRYSDYARLKAEFERLRVAGEDLAHAVRTKHGVDFALEEWDAVAKKGGQS